MYRAPISSGRDAIGAAIGAGLANAAGAAAGGLQERRRRELEEEERARRDRLDAIAEQERQRRIAIENAEMGVIDQDAAMTGDAIERAVVGPDGRVTVPPGATLQPGATPRRMREGVTQVGGLYIDPKRSLAYQRQEISRQDQRAEEQRELERRADALQAMDPQMDRGDAIARAMGLSATDPLTTAEAEAGRRREFELRDEFDQRGERRSNTEWNRREGTRRRELTAGQSRDRVQSTAQGFAMTAADEAIRLAAEHEAGTRRAGPGWTPLAHIRSNLRAQARAQGLDLNEGEIQNLAVRALHASQDQAHQLRPRAQGDDLFGDMEDPIGSAAGGTTAAPAANNAQRAALVRARQEYDALYDEVQKIPDPRQRQAAMRELGQRP